MTDGAEVSSPTVLELGRGGEPLVCSLDFPDPWAPGIPEKVASARMRQYRRWRRRGSRIRRRAVRAGVHIPVIEPGRVP